jgi:O-antigen/teichoic acid export membrane protein
MRAELSRGVATNALIQLFGLMTGIVLARSLGPAGRGDFAVALFWPQTLASLFLLGAETSLARAAAKRSSDVFPLAMSATCIALALGGCGILVGYLTLPSILGESKAYLLHQSTYTLVVIPFSLLNVYLASVLLGAGRYTQYNASRLSFYPLYFALLIALVLASGVTVDSCLVMFLIAASAAPLINGYAYFIRNRVTDSDAKSVNLRELLSESRGNAISFAVYVCYAQFPILVLTRLGSAEAIGLFVIAATIATAVTTVTGAAAKVFLSQASRAKDISAVLPVVTNLRKVILLTLICVLALQLMTPFLVTLIFGSAFSGASSLAMPLVLAAGLSGVSFVVDEILKGRGVTRAGINSRLMFIAVALTCLAVPLHHAAEYRLAYGMLLGGFIELFLISTALAAYVKVGLKQTIWPGRKDVIEIGESIRNLIRPHH